MDVDLEKFFDTVNHDILIDRLQRRIGDPGVIRLIRAYLNSGIMTDGRGGPALSGHAAGRAPHATYTKDNFEFERRIALNRTLRIVDMRRKK